MRDFYITSYPICLKGYITGKPLFRLYLRNFLFSDNVEERILEDIKSNKV